MYDFGQATACMVLAAAGLGTGSGHSAVASQQQARRVLGFPGGYPAVYLIGLSYPTGRPLRPLAKPGRRWRAATSAVWCPGMGAPGRAG